MRTKPWLLVAAVPLLLLAAAPVPAAHAATTGPDVGVTMAASPDPVALFGTLTYTISVTNTDASQTATGVAVTDTLVDDPTLQVAAQVPSFGSTITSASSTFAGSTCTIAPPPPQAPQVQPATSYYTTPWMATCTFGNLPPATTAVATVTVKVQRTNTAGEYAPNPVVNQVHVTSTSMDPNPANDSAQTATCVTFPSQQPVCAPGT